ncbi:protein transport protein Sec24-like At4g32640 [Macadamia integrifolia]|uniref:protein transport protein Sec24-like At4g32640 n=1 Tax=Macadamia integrifolia TaxID=60698 RepID=UPI001C5272A3|nr:protein transport protein Sec24-like At4g32640 [Macadamia integrifolia]
MASPVPSGVPRPGNHPPPPPNYNPNVQRTAADSMADGMQNLQINRPPSMPNQPVHRPPPFAPSPFSATSASSAPTSAQFSGYAPAPRSGPPPAGFTRAGPPPTGPPNAAASLRPSGAPPPFGSRPPPPPGALPSSPFMTSPVVPPSNPSSVQGPMSNGPPAFASGPPRFPPSGSVQQPPVGPPQVSDRMPQAPPSIRPFPVSPAGSFSHGPPSQPVPPLPPFQAASAPPHATQSLHPFSSASPYTTAPYGAQAWQMQPRQVAPPIPGAQPPSMFRMPPPPPLNQPMTAGPPAMSHLPVPGTPASGPSKIDPNQIPRPVPSSSVILFETRQGNQANLPPPATSDYIVKDTGNCSPRFMRCSINQIPCTGDLLTTSGMQLALMVQPLALPHPSEDPIQVVDFGDSGPVRCSRCKGYINPFMKFIDQGRRFICNLCGFTDETPREYHCNLGPDGRRRDADERPELCRGTVEFVATKEYLVRDPMPAVFFFLIDVSMNAIQTGATAAACSAINQVIADLPEGPRTFVGIATYDSTIHFYNLKRALQQPLMLIVPDVQDVYTPLQTDVIVQVSECRQHLVQLLENIPTMFQSNKVADSAFGAAIKAAFLAMKTTGGKLLVFQSVLPSVGIGALFAREAEGRTNISAGEKEAHKMLQPADKTLKTMAIEFSEYQVCVDVFITTQSYVDIASISVVPKTTGGQVLSFFTSNFHNIQHLLNKFMELLFLCLKKNNRLVLLRSFLTWYR